MEEKDIIVDEISIDTVGEVEQEVLEVTDSCDLDTVEVGEVVGKALTLNSLNFDPKDGELTYGENVAVYTGKFTYTTIDAPDKEFEIDGSIAFNIKALNNVVLDASEDGKTLEIHLDQAFLTKVDNLELNKADKKDLTALTEIVEQVQLAQGADAIAIVGLQSDVLTIKETIKNLATFSVKIVNELPTSDISTTTIYLLAKQDAQGSDYYDEYLFVEGSWELIGTTKVDLTDYYKKTEVDAMVEGLADEIEAQDTNINNLGGRVGELEADVKDLQDQIDEIHTDDLVDLETNQEIGGVKTFKNQVGFKNEDGTIDYIKHINNNLLITTSTGTNLLNIDEGLSRVYFFNKEVAFKEDIAESSGTTVKVGGVAVAEFDADTKADASTVEQIGAEVNSLDMMVESLGEDVSQQGTKVNALDAQLVSLATQVAIDYYNKTDADGKFVGKGSANSVKIISVDTYNVWEMEAGIYHLANIDIASRARIRYNPTDTAQTIDLQYGGVLIVSKRTYVNDTTFILFDAQYMRVYNGWSNESGGDIQNLVLNDSELSLTSINGVQNKTVTEAIYNLMSAKPTPDYDTGWFKIAKSSTYTFTHDLGTMNFYTLIDIVYDNGTNYFYKQGVIINPDGTASSYAGGIEEGSRTTTKIHLTTAKNYAYAQSRAVNDVGTAYTDFTASDKCWARARLFKLGGSDLLWK